MTDIKPAVEYLEAYNPSAVGEVEARIKKDLCAMRADPDIRSRSTLGYTINRWDDELIITVDPALWYQRQQLAEQRLAELEECLSQKKQQLVELTTTDAEILP